MNMFAKEELWALVTRLYPIHRSITGDGVRKTLNIIKDLIPIEIHEVPSGTKAFDWVVPPEWNIKDAYIRDGGGARVVDFRKNNLHIVNYSIPFEGTMTLKDLQTHLHSLPKQPEAIPYVTSYYQKNWGFCLAHHDREKLRAGVKYHIKIDSNFAEDGSLTYADLLIKGKTDKEVLISTYICHPSLANDNISGPVLATFLAKQLSTQQNHFSYRFVFIPETIGSIVYLSRHLEHLKKHVVAGYVITCVGDDGHYSYMLSRNEKTLTDRITRHVLEHSKESYELYSYLERGSDERQYCSPGVDLPIGSLMRSKYYTFPEYHTSLDNLEFISANGMFSSFKMYLKCIEAIECNKRYYAVHRCEPQLGKRNLYPNLSKVDSAKDRRAFMNFLAYCDGDSDLLDIADKIGVSIFDLNTIALTCLEAGLVVENK